MACPKSPTSDSLMPVLDQGGRGRGLAAARDIKAGEVLSVRPAVARDAKSHLSRAAFAASACLPPASSGAYLVSDPTVSGVARLNDAAAPEAIAMLSKLTTDYELAAWAKHIYPNDSKARNASVALRKNIIIQSGGASPWSVVAVADRDIGAGEDVFISYGAQFWVDLRKLDTDLKLLTAQSRG